MLRSRVARYACLVSVVFVLFGAAGASAQTFTVNGSSGAMTVYRGATLTVAAGSGSTSGDWVGLHAVGAGCEIHRNPCRVFTTN